MSEKRKREADDAIQIFILTPNSGTKAITIDVSSSIHELKGAIQDRIGIPPEYMRLTYQSKCLEDESR